ncbi:MAG: ATP-binding cassette domain-containing protein [Acidimicrobiia bacterium]|nr:ATP-binding cassette domain-containing protein [Acidimicrobiia bacterium]
MGRHDPSAVAGRHLERDVLKRVWRFAGHFRAQIVGYLVAVVAGSLAGLAAPLVVRSLLNEAIPQGDRGWVNLLAVLLVAAALGEAALSLIARWLSSRVGEGLIYDLRVALYDHVQRMPLAFFTNSQTGTLVSRLNNDVVGAQSAVTSTLGTVVSNVVTLVSTLVAMAVLEWRLTALALVILPVFLLGSRRVGRKLQVLTRRSMDFDATMNAQMTERFGVSGSLLVTLFGRHRSEAKAFSERAAAVRDIGVKTAVYGRTFMLGLGVVGALGTAAVYWVGSQLVIGGGMRLGDLVAMGMLVGRLYPPLTALTNARVEVLSAFVSFDRVFEVLDAPNPITDKPGALSLVVPAGAIEVDHVSFAYPTASSTTLASLAGGAAHERASAPVLHDVTARIEPGQTVAVVGPSGAGKSTLASLIARLYDVGDGAVRVDGVDVRDLTLESLRDAIGVVSQDPHLFHDTVAANLRYAKPEATDEELVAAARLARIHDVIAALPEGYGTTVGERGYRLSGGEKQRLAIARMLLKDPRVVVLDEATSHLDAENEALIQQALEQALAGRTALVIAHRLSTITTADQILVMDEGRVVERGRHADLLAAGGLYAELYHTLLRDGVAPTSPLPSPATLGGGAARG